MLAYATSKLKVGRSVCCALIPSPLRTTHTQMVDLPEAQFVQALAAERNRQVDSLNMGAGTGATGKASGTGSAGTAAAQPPAAIQFQPDPGFASPDLPIPARGPRGRD